MRSKAHHRGNTPSLSVAAPRSTNPTSIPKKPSPSIGSPSVCSRTLPYRKESASPTSKSDTPRKDATKPTDPSRPYLDACRVCRPTSPPNMPTKATPYSASSKGTKPSTSGAAPPAVAKSMMPETVHASPANMAPSAPHRIKLLRCTEESKTPTCPISRQLFTSNSLLNFWTPEVCDLCSSCCLQPSVFSTRAVGRNSKSTASGVKLKTRIDG
jgi:hypothetical protein